MVMPDQNAQVSAAAAHASSPTCVLASLCSGAAAAASPADSSPPVDLSTSYYFPCFQELLASQGHEVS